MAHPNRLFLVALLLVLLAGAPTVASDGEVEWIHEIGKAFKSSADSNKPIFVDVWAVWCAPCKQMDVTTYKDPAIRKAMHGFVPLKVDQDSSEIFCEKHDAEGLPLVLYLDAEGREIGRRMGLQQTDELLPSMQIVRDGYAAYLEAMTEAKQPEAAQSIATYLAEAGNAAGAVEILRRATKAAGKTEAAEELALRLAETQLEAGDARAACAGFQRLADKATVPEVRGQALRGLVQAEVDRGRLDRAGQALERLKQEFPELAVGLQVDE